MSDKGGPPAAPAAGPAPTAPETGPEPASSDSQPSGSLPSEAEAAAAAAAPGATGHLGGLAAADKWRAAAAGTRLVEPLETASGASATAVNRLRPRRRTTVRDMGAAAFKLISGRTNIRRWIDQVMKREAGAEQEDQVNVARRFLFEDEDRRYDKPGGSENAKVEDFNEVVDVDEARVETFVSQELVGHLTNSKTFNFSIFLIIIFNSVLIAMQTSDELTERFSLIFSVIDQVVLTIFIFEIAIKWFYGFYAFWLGAWNIIDFVVIFILLFGNNFTYLASSRLLRLLRVLRAFRSVRSFSTSLESLSLVVDTILHSIPDMANVSLLLLVFMTVASVIGVTVFGDDYEENFGNLMDALFVCFICVTEDGWVDIFKPMRDAKNGNLALASSVYFLFLITIGAFVFSNLIVAVVVTNLEIAMRDYTEEKNAERGPLFGSYITGTGAAAAAGDDEDDDDEPEDVAVKVVSLDPLLTAESGFMAGQRPVQVPPARRPAPGRVARYAAALLALQENMTEYRAVRADLSQAAGVVADLDELLQRQLTAEERDPAGRLRRASQLLPRGSAAAAHPSVMAVHSSVQAVPGDIVRHMETLQLVRASQSRPAGRLRRISAAILGREGGAEHDGEPRPKPLHRMNQY